MAAFVGQLASVGASVCWSGASVLLTKSGQEVGSVVVNRTRLLFAFAFVLISHQVAMGQPIPTSVETSRLGWLSLSGVLGFAIGDGLLFQAFLLIGPRLAMLMMSLTPAFSILLALIFLNEGLVAVEIVGIVVTATGIVLVISDGRRYSDKKPLQTQSKFLPGILMGLGAAIAQASGLLLSKLGLADNFSSLSGNVIRLAVATAVIWALALVSGQAGDTLQKLHRHRRATWITAGGALLGPFVGVWLSLVAIQRAPLGVVSTLTNLSPVFLLPISYIMLQERFGVLAIVGTVVAIVGTGILFIPT